MILTLMETSGDECATMSKQACRKGMTDAERYAASASAAAETMHLSQV